jgi:hypothetical protein
MFVRIAPPQGRSVPRGKLADAIVVFEDHDGILAGTELHGFTLWEGREQGQINVTVPGRQYKDREGADKTFNYIRGARSIDDVAPLKDAIIAAYHGGDAGERF